MCPTNVSCRDMVILIQYIIQTFKEPKLMPVISTVRKFNANGVINPTLHRMHHGRIISVLRFRSSKTWSGVTSQRTGIFNNTTVKISEHAFLHLLVSGSSNSGNMLWANIMSRETCDMFGWVRTACFRGCTELCVFLVKYHIENCSDETFMIEWGKHFIKYACLPNCNWYSIFGVVTGLLDDWANVVFICSWDKRFFSSLQLLN